jgi:phosphatidate cytidylyltransferase
VEVEMLRKRVLSAIIGVPLILFVLYMKGLYLYFFVAALSIVGIYEYYRAMRNININTNAMFGYISVIIYYLMFLMPITFDRPGFIVAFSVMVLFTIEIITQKHNISEISITLLGIVYIPFLFSHLLFIENMKYGSIILWLPFLTAWFTDTSAYFTGVTIGKHKIFPTISPKKTLEGYIGGIIGSGLLTTIFGIIVSRYDNSIGLTNYIVIGLICAIASELGDLASSYIKRQTGIKDFGNLIPGHGGILDRFDSILFTAPVVFYYFTLI